MRIAIDARELAGRATGVGRYLRQLLRAWSTMPGIAHHDFILCTAEPLDASVEADFTAGLRSETVVERGCGTVWEQTMLPRLVREARADVLFAPGYTAPLLVTVPTVLVVHDVSFSAHPEWFSWREGLRRRVLTRLSARRAARVLTVSDFSKREIARHLGVSGDRVEVIYHGTTTLAAPGGSARREPMVLYVGSLFERRHIPQLIAGFARFAQDERHATLEIVGDSRTRTPIDVAALAAAAGVGSRVHARSYVTDRELADLYSRAAAFAFLSDYEGFGMTPLEAMASGVPPVVLDTEVAREVYGPAAVYVAGPDPSAIATGLHTAFTNGEALRAAAPQVLMRYSWDECARRTLRAILSAA